jgi:hypothetical protein
MSAEALGRGAEAIFEIGAGLTIGGWGASPEERWPQDAANSLILIRRYHLPSPSRALFLHTYRNQRAYVITRPRPPDEHPKILRPKWVRMHVVTPRGQP